LYEDLILLAHNLLAQLMARVSIAMKAKEKLL